MKSPTLTLVAPAFTLAPLVLLLTCNLSGNAPVVVRVQNVNLSPFFRFTLGQNNQLLIILAPEVLLKFAPIYPGGVFPGNTPVFPWNQLVRPSGLLRFCAAQPAGKGTTVLKVSLNKLVATGGPPAWLSIEEVAGWQGGGGEQSKPVTVMV